jgi:hypothetical protein
VPHRRSGLAARDSALTNDCSASFRLRVPFGRGPDEKIFPDLNFERSEFFADLIALDFGKNVTALHRNYLARFDLLLRK